MARAAVVVVVRHGLGHALGAEQRDVHGALTPLDRTELADPVAGDPSAAAAAVLALAPRRSLERCLGELIRPACRVAARPGRLGLRGHWSSSVVGAYDAEERRRHHAGCAGRGGGGVREAAACGRLLAWIRESPGGWSASG